MGIKSRVDDLRDELGHRSSGVSDSVRRRLENSFDMCAEDYLSSESQDDLDDLGDVLESADRERARAFNEEALARSKRRHTSSIERTVNKIKDEFLERSGLTRKSYYDDDPYDRFCRRSHY